MNPRVRFYPRVQFKDYYAVLGVPKTATQDEIRKAFRKLATNQDLIPIYKKWFNARLPTGEKMDVAISPQLEDSFKVLDGSAGGKN